jgi:hypothetical protein
MSKRTVFTTVTPLPNGITRETVMETLHSHTEMIDLNPLVEERHPIKPPPNASPEEYHCLWYSLTDRVQYLPGGMMSGKVSYNVCFHDLERGLQTHCYAPMGLNIRGKWTLGGSLPGEPIAPVELGLGAPLQGLYLREDVDMKCNIMMTSFVKKTLKKAHSALVGRLLIKAQILDASLNNQRIVEKTLLPIPNQFTGSQASTQYSPSDYGESPTGVEAPQIPPLQGLGFRGSVSTDFPDKANHSDHSLYPQALNVRNSVSSHSGSIGSQTGRASYQESVPGNQSLRASYQESLQGNQNPRSSYQESPPAPHDQRVSWQNLNPNRSPSFQNQQIVNRSRSPSLQQVDPACQNANPYRVSAASYHAELPSSNGGDLRQPEPKFVSKPAGYQTPPPQYGHAELE